MFCSKKSGFESEAGKECCDESETGRRGGRLPMLHVARSRMSRSIPIASARSPHCPSFSSSAYFSVGMATLQVVRMLGEEVCLYCCVCFCV